jgi:hypothetical protein
MKAFRPNVLAGLVATAMALALLVAGCAGIPNDDRYQIHDGGRSNTRAEAPSLSATLPS